MLRALAAAALCSAVLVGAAAAAAVTVTPSDEQREARIIGGRRMDDGDIPYQVSIRSKEEGSPCTDMHFCGGTIISLDAILTAAHCMRRHTGDADPRTLCIVAGTVHVRAITENTTRVERDVARVYVHEEYNPQSTGGHDVAVLRLASPLPATNPYVRIIPLQTDEVKEGWCFVTGWGLTTESGNADIPPILMGVHVPFIPSPQCREQFYHCRIHEDEICAGMPLGGKDACQGDSGGPFVCNSMVTGIVSWGIGCGRKNSPGVYSNVKFYRSWIQDKMNLSPQAPQQLMKTNVISKDSGDGGASARIRCANAG